MLGVFAEFETAIGKERQMEGISKAKAEGRYKGRPTSIEAEMVRKLRGEGIALPKCRNISGSVGPVITGA